MNMNIAFVLAGGSGTRMGNIEKPKQFLALGSKPIIIHTIEAFKINKNIDAILVLVPENWKGYTVDLIEKYDLDGENVFVHVGGASRNETILSGCKFIEDKFDEQDYIILTHDSVRPFITQRIIDENIKNVSRGFSVDTVIPAIDTIVCSENGNTISKIPNRNNMYQGQTPQTFYHSDFMQILTKVSVQDLSKYSDACGMFLDNGLGSVLVKGEQYNIKITTQYDLDIANSILEVK